MQFSVPVILFGGELKTPANMCILLKTVTLIAMNISTSWYNDPCIIRPPIQPEKYGLKLKMVLNWGDSYIEY